MFCICLPIPEKLGAISWTVYHTLSLYEILGSKMNPEEIHMYTWRICKTHTFIDIEHHLRTPELCEHHCTHFHSCTFYFLSQAGLYNRFPRNELGSKCTLNQKYSLFISVLRIHSQYH